MMENKESKNKEQKTENREQRTEGKKQKSRKSPGLGRLYFGLVLIGFGALLLLDALDLVAFNFTLLLAFILPLVLVGVGLSLLKVQSRIIGLILVVLTLAAFVFAAVFARTNEPTNEQFNVGQSADKAEVRLNLGASDINVSSAQLQDDLIRGEFKSAYSELKTESEVEDGTQNVEVNTEGSGDDFWNIFKTGASNLDIELAEGIPLALSIGAGAVDLDMDLRTVQLTSLTIETGASDIDVQLNEPLQKTPVTIDSGVSSIKLDIPEDTAVRLRSEGALNSVKISGVENNNGTFTTDNFEDAESYYDITVDAGLSEVTVEWY